MNKQIEYIKYCKKYEEMRKDIIKIFQINPKSEIIKENARDKAQRNIPIPKDKLCEICNERKAEFRHHEDYSKPLEIIFICKSCHNKLHGVVTT